jgi:hypothetical protein
LQVGLCKLQSVSQDLIEQEAEVLYKYRVYRVSVPQGRGEEPLELPGRIVHVLGVSDSGADFVTLQVLVEEADASG